MRCRALKRDRRASVSAMASWIAALPSGLPSQSSPRRCSRTRRRVRGVRRSCATLSPTLVTSTSSRSISDIMPLTVAASMSTSSRRRETGRREARSPSITRRQAACTSAIRRSGPRLSSAPRPRPARMMIEPHDINDTSKILRRPVSTLALKPTNRISPQGSRLARPRAPGSNPRTFSSRGLPSTGRFAGRTRTLPVTQTPSAENRP